MAGRAIGRRLEAQGRGLRRGRWKLWKVWNCGGFGVEGVEFVEGGGPVVAWPREVGIAQKEQGTHGHGRGGHRAGGCGCRARWGRNRGSETGRVTVSSGRQSWLIAAQKDLWRTDALNSLNSLPRGRNSRASSMPDVPEKETLADHF